MTRAPESLLAVRALLLTHLGPHGLRPDAVGIVGDATHRGGYHCGADRTAAGDYSVVESPRDRTGLTLDAAALDIGWFEVRVGGVTHNLYTFNRWIVAQLEAGTPDSRDIREWIYTLDGKTVRRWDRLKKRTSGDSSHLWHSHGSWFRDAIKAGKDLTPLFRRYLTTIGLLEDAMALTNAQAAQLANVERMLGKLLKGGLGAGPDGRPDNAATWWLRMLADNTDPLVAKAYPQQPDGNWRPIPAGLAQIAAQVAAARADIAALAIRSDTQAVIAGVLEGLTPSAIAAAIPPALTRQVADELARRLAS
ncbi:hypothetical protein AB0C02_30380 [Micromonospora sp. NPDC048999]|uniref:hypothetical protein n=1 Tax=Micromonospora sp. NPDC048999 TaxID=3155391 RepID=UPI0033EF467A